MHVLHIITMKITVFGGQSNRYAIHVTVNGTGNSDACAGELILHRRLQY